MFHSAAEENKPSNRPQNSPPASWCLFCNQFVPMNVSVDTFPPSQPACEWVPGTSTAVTAEKGDRNSSCFLETDLWAAWQVPGQSGGRWAAVHARWGRDRDRSAKDSRGAKAFMPCLGNGVTGKVEPIPQHSNSQHRSDHWDVLRAGQGPGAPGKEGQGDVYSPPAQRKTLLENTTDGFGG